MAMPMTVTTTTIQMMIQRSMQAISRALTLTSSLSTPSWSPRIVSFLCLCRLLPSSKLLAPHPSHPQDLIPVQSRTHEVGYSLPVKVHRVQGGNTPPPPAKPLRENPPLLLPGTVVPPLHQTGFRSRASSTCAMSATTAPVEPKEALHKPAAAAAARATGDGAPGGALSRLPMSRELHSAAPLCILLHILAATGWFSTACLWIENFNSLSAHTGPAMTWSLARIVRIPCPIITDFLLALDLCHITVPPNHSFRINANSNMCSLVVLKPSMTQRSLCFHHPSRSCFICHPHSFPTSVHCHPFFFFPLLFLVTFASLFSIPTLCTYYSHFLCIPSIPRFSLIPTAQARSVFVSHMIISLYIHYFPRLHYFFITST